MNEFRDIPLRDAENTKEVVHTDMGGNSFYETTDAAETEILTAVSDPVPEETGEEPDIAAGEMQDGIGPVRHRKNHRRRNIVIAAVAAAVVVLAGGAGGYAYAASNVQKGADAAYANAQAVDSELSGKLAEARELLDGTEEAKVADGQTLEALSDAIEKADAQSGVKDAGANHWLVWQEMDARAAYDADASDAEDAIRRLEQAMSDVNDSMSEKTLADAKQALQSAVDGADKTYADSDGKVQDNATRDTLKTTLDAAKKVLADDSVTDAKTYSDRKTAVDNAVKTVNDSIAAKQKADADAEAAAKAAASASSASSGSSGGYYSGGSTSNYGGSYYGGGYSGGSTGGSSTPSYNSGSNGGYTAPSGGNTSGGGATSTPSSDTGGDMSFDWVEGDSDFNDNPWY